jgi:hypothetical protein
MTDPIPFSSEDLVVGADPCVRKSERFAFAGLRAIHAAKGNALLRDLQFLL